jgi:hypothetical protein
MAQMHRNALHDPLLPPNAKTQLRRKLSRHVFCGIRTDPTRARKIVRICFAPWMHSNPLRDQQIPPDAKTQVWHKVSQRTFSGIRTGPTQVRKMVPRHFAP